MQSNKFRIFITGSSGFIGTHLVKALINLGYTVGGIDIQPPAFSINNFHFVKCDILNANELERILSDHHPQSVIHLAARTDLDGKNTSDYAANIDGVQNLVKAIANVSSVQRCIYTSSQLVCRVGYIPEDEQEYCANTLYGESKVLTEKIVRKYDGAGIEWCLVRPTTVWGAGMKTHYQRLFKMICQGRYFHVGRRPLHKSYGYIGNIVHQYQKLLEAPVEFIHRKIFYLADYEPISLRAWLDAFQRELGTKPIHTLPKSLANVMAITGDIIIALGVKSFPFNSFRLKNILTEYQFDLTGTETVCGPLPYNMEQGVRETAAWIRTLK